jgi:outer membrane protein OmpA-like peptidoglycan-associated protein
LYIFRKNNVFKIVKFQFLFKNKSYFRAIINSTMIRLFTIFLCFSFCSVFGQEQFSVFFDSNKWDLKKTELTKLNSWINKNTAVKIIGANGYCDEDGSTILNDTLSKRRIDFVYKLLKSKIKFRADFKTHSFGKLLQTSKIKAENRRVTLFYIQPKDFEKEEEILGIKKIAPEPQIIPKPKPIKFPEKMLFENPDGSKTEFQLDTIFMHKIDEARVGEKLKLENINFIINTFAIVKESRGKLYELLFVLQKNPKLKIEIQGHLCCNPIDKQGLSTERAKAISKFLIYNGINQNRLLYKGFGGSLPIFPLPEKTEQEALANRRVEILILEN